MTVSKDLFLPTISEKSNKTSVSRSSTSEGECWTLEAACDEWVGMCHIGACTSIDSPCNSLYCLISSGTQRWKNRVTADINTSRQTHRLHRRSRLFTTSFFIQHPPRLSRGVVCQMLSHECWHWFFPGQLFRSSHNSVCTTADCVTAGERNCLFLFALLLFHFTNKVNPPSLQKAVS